MARREFCRHCFENGRVETWHGPECRAYDAQLSFTRRVRRLLAAPWHERPVPQAPDYSTPEGVTRAAVAGGAGDHLPANGEALGVKFARALRATGDGWERDVLHDWRRPPKKATPRRRRKAVAV